ncbi:helix-turn-helix domain-containing protein [Streptomyces beihaiensis]|uniref:Helix-turn-helix transcriptional regulator n=1 Tax=Streptomyces beihaiensis TaxID=2984495 RepID=A0ABT3TSS2_9ACTN|nr:helix-turn-helix transcriptional regulator [Streptomyces beihaiensis]MCX3060066.1 helix-turn-helix transcriptional regulator [Streptomyces beihaiensis]
MTTRTSSHADGPAHRAVPGPEPLWRHVVGDALRRERREQGRTLQDVAGVAGISMTYLSEVERGRKEASSEMLAAVAGALGLGLGDVLERAQAELVYAARRRRAVAVTSLVSVRAAQHSRQAAGGHAGGAVCLAA